MKDIPIHQMEQRGGLGLEMRHFAAGSELPKDAFMGAHRDDHYLFFLIESGTASMMIDFEEISFDENTLYYILPGQVHHRITNKLAFGWFVAIDTSLVSADYRGVFESRLQVQQPYHLNELEKRQFNQILYLLDEKYQEDYNNAFYLPVMHSLLQSFIGIAAVCFNCSNNRQQRLSRPAQLAQLFKKLLVENVRTVKMPSAYAAMLNVSESYLNESLKKTTGLPVSYWITQEVVLEAKRLLYYSELNVKEIAHTLGFEDHAYFSRLFKKSANSTPLAFKAQYHK